MFRYALTPCFKRNRHRARIDPGHRRLIEPLCLTWIAFTSYDRMLPSDSLVHVSWRLVSPYSFVGPLDQYSLLGS